MTTNSDIEKVAGKLSFPMDWKTFAQVVVIISLLIEAGIVGVQVSLIVSLEDRLTNLENQVNVPFNSKTSAFIKQANFIISVQEGYYLLWNGTGDSAGKLEYYSTNASQVINFAVGNLTTGGTIGLGSGNFSLSAPILLNGDNANQKQWIIEGLGVNNTKICPQANVDCFQFENQANVILQDFSIILPSNSGGIGINGIDVGYSPFYAMSIIQRLYLYGGSQWLIYIANPQYITLRDLYLFPTGTGGMCFNETSAVANFGNCIFDGHVFIDINANNGIGIMFTRSARTTHILNMMNSFGYLEISSSYSGYTNTTGIYASSLAYSTLEGIESETVHRPIFCDIVLNCFFIGQGHCSVNGAGDTFVTLTSNAYENTFKDFFYTPVSGNGTAFSGGTTDPRYPNIFEDWIIEAGYNVNNSVVGGTIVRNMLLDTSLGGTFQGFSGSPVGYVANPINGGNLQDFGGVGTIANNTLYTVYGSSKSIYLTGGAFNGASYNVTVNGQVIFSNLATGPTMMIHLEAGDTILFGWSSSPTIKVYGE